MERCKPLKEIVKKMYNPGMSIEQIIDITELTKKELEKLLQPENI